MKGERIFCIANGLFCRQLAGGDVHLLHSIRSMVRAGFQVECFSGEILESYLKEWSLPAKVIFTDKPNQNNRRHIGLRGQLSLFWIFFCRMVATLKKLRLVAPDAVVFSATDYWFDVLPLALSRARLKVVVLQMQAPTLREVIFRSRADVDVTRIASLHYCLSQWLSLMALRRCRCKRLIIVQPLLKKLALKMGFLPSEIVHIPNGVDVETSDSAPAQKKQFDVVWMGRVHRQKGIDDLLKTLQFLAQRFSDFRALLIGNLEHLMGEQVKDLGLTANVEFAGYIAGVEKFSRLKSARLFLMPSRHEGLPIVVGEALACDLPVVAYELEMYRPFFGSLLTYVPCFDAEKFCATAAMVLQRLRNNELLLNSEELARFKHANAWTEVELQLATALIQPTRQSMA